MNQSHEPSGFATPLIIRTILYLQKRQLPEQQRELVSNLLSREFRGVEITFADDIEGVPLGASFDVVIAPTLAWLPEALQRLRNYRWIHFLSAGIEKIWQMDFDKTLPILTKSTGVHGSPMSEYAIGAMLYFTKQFGRFREQSHHREWRRAWLGELTGRQLTILGLGHVGSCLARRAKAFDMHVAGTLRTPRPVEHVDRIVPLADIGELLLQTDFLVVCLPLTEDTRGVVDDAFLAQLKPRSVLIDISRGGVVKGDAVIRALEAGTLEGAALDVFEQQPLPVDSPMWQRDDLLITPHVSGTTPYYLERALNVFIENYRAKQKGFPLLTPINIASGY